MTAPTLLAMTTMSSGAKPWTCRRWRMNQWKSCTVVLTRYDKLDVMFAAFITMAPVAEALRLR